MDKIHLISTGIIIVWICLCIHGYIIAKRGRKALKLLIKVNEELELKNKELQNSLDFANRKPLRFTPAPINSGNEVCGSCGGRVQQLQQPCPTDGKYYCHKCLNKAAYRR